MGDWAEAWWWWFTNQHPANQTMILAGAGILLCSIMLGVPWAAGRRDRYIGRRRRGWLIEPEPASRFETHFPKFARPEDVVTKRRIRTAFAVPWDGISGAHRTIADPQEATRRLHPGDVNAARASVEQTQTRMRLNSGWRMRMDAHAPGALEEERVRRFGKEYLEKIRSGADGDYSGQTRRLRLPTEKRAHEEERREDRECGEDESRPLEDGKEGGAYAERQKVGDANIYWRSDPRTGQIVMVDARGNPIDWDSGE